MSNSFGPWATSIDAGGNPQLSAFWRRRLTMLAAASEASPAISRRHALCLVAAGLLIAGLPTLRSAPAVAVEAKPADAGAKPSLPPIEERFWGISHSPFYFHLDDADVVAKVRLTPQQQKELEALAKQIRSKPFSPNYKASARQKIEAILSPQQLQAVKELAYPNIEFYELDNSKALEMIGASDQQKQKLHELRVEACRRDQQLVFDKVKQWLDVFRPEQQAKLCEDVQHRIDAEIAERKAGTRRMSAAGGSLLVELVSIGDDRIAAYPELTSVWVRQRLKLTEDQERRLRDYVAEYQTRVHARDAELIKLAKVSVVQSNRRTAEVDAAEAKMAAQRYRQVEAILTPQQLAALKDIVLQKEMGIALLSRDTPTLMGASPEQRASLRRLFDEANKQSQAIWDDASRRAAALLTPRQHQLLREDFDRRWLW